MKRKWPQSLAVALLIVMLLPLSQSGNAEATDVTILPDAPRFLTLPFADTDINIQQGWIYEWDPLHGGIDFVKGPVDYTPGWEPFDVLAAAAGEAIYYAGHADYGDYVIIEHTGGGIGYYSFYAHMGTVDIPYGVWTPVERGQKLGTSGDSGAPGLGIHLHFTVCAGGYYDCVLYPYVPWPEDMTDPYDIWLKRAHYPPNGPMGPNYLWTTDPPSPPSVDNTPPVISFNPSNPTPNQWYNIDKTLSWTVSDPETGVDYFKWAWDITPPYHRVDDDHGSTTLSAAGQGQHNLFVQAWNGAGMFSAVESPPGWFGYDTISPTNPTSILPGCAAGNNVWQNSCSDPNFSWSGASDGNGSGVKDYHYYWGDNPSGALTTYTADTAYDPPAVPGPVAIYYLRMATRDNLNQEGTPATLFVLRYDASPPIAAVLINNGALTTTQVDVTLNLSVSDAGSGVNQVRASNNNVDWSPWQPYSAEIPWTLPALDRRELSVYVQVRDRAGNVSDVVSDTIYLDFYPPPPHSDSYRICGDVWDAAGGRLTSASYLLHSAVGQSALGNPESDGYAHDGGFLAGLDSCLSITRPNPLNFTVTQWVIAAGGNLRSSGSYRVGDTAGEPAASAANAFTSTNYVLSSGFWGNVTGIVPPPPPTGTVTPTPLPPTPTPVATATPTPTPPPGNFGIQINGGDIYTNDRIVTVTAWAPNVTWMRLSNDGAYQDNNWFPYQITSTWVLSATGEPLRFVYAWFRDDEDTVYGPYPDNITYDADPPYGSIEVLGSGEITVTLWLPAYDDLSGVSLMRISDTVTMTLVPWQPHAQILPWILRNPTVYAQYRDGAGNESPVYSSAIEQPAMYSIYLPLLNRNVP